MSLKDEKKIQASFGVAINKRRIQIQCEFITFYRFNNVEKKTHIYVCSKFETSLMFCLIEVLKYFNYFKNLLKKHLFIQNFQYLMFFPYAS